MTIVKRAKGLCTMRDMPRIPMSEQCDGTRILVRYKPSVQLHIVIGPEPGVFKTKPGRVPIAVGILHRMKDLCLLETGQG
jgi:hypothetical protein